MANGMSDTVSVEISDLVEKALAAITSLRKDGMHLHSITNTVAQNFTANVLLACGATVSMTSNTQEMADFVDRASALHINLGTLDNERMSAIRKAVEIAARSNMPIMLDPVMVHVSSLRKSFARELAGRATIIRGNQAEINSLKETLGDDVCLVETGQTDKITFLGKWATVDNGHPMMSDTIATGCALGALIGALSTKSEDRMVASLAALLWFSIAGEIAAEKAKGPGSFQIEFFDALNLVSLQEIRKRAKVGI